MKRSVFVSLAFVVVFASVTAAQSANGEEVPRVSLRFTGEERARIVAAIAPELGLTVPASELTQDCGTYTGRVEAENIFAVIGQVMANSGCEAVLEGTTLRIRRVAAAPAAVLTTPAATQAAAALPPGSYLTMPDGQQVLLNERLQSLQAARGEQFVAGLIAYEMDKQGGIYRNRYGYTTYRPNYRSTGLGYSGYGYNDTPWMKGCATGVSGRIKFKYLGNDGEHHLWRVRVNGERVGTIDQGDSVWNEIRVCAGPNRIAITKAGQARQYEDTWSVRPFELTEIDVGEHVFLDDGR